MEENEQVMEQEAQDRRVLVKYLLGKLSEQEQDALAERYFIDEGLFDQLLTVENDLLDQYVRGQLAADQREEFARYLNKLPDGRHKVAVATALMREERAAAEAMLDQEAPQPTSTVMTAPEPGDPWWRSLPALIPRRRAALQYSLAASLVVVTSIALWLVIDSRQLRRENDQLQAQMAQREAEQETLRQRAQTLEQQSDAQQTRTEQVPGESERERQRSTAPAQEIARLKEPPAPLDSLILTPASRSFSTPDTLVLKRGAKFALLTVPIKGTEKYTRRTAVLQTTEGEQVQRLKGRFVRSPRLGKAVVFRLPTSQLTQTGYKLTLVLMAEDELELAPDYYFNIVKR